MQITRRAFSQGMGGLFGAKLAPGGPAVAAVLPAEAGFEDAYEKLLCEYIRVEETAIVTGRSVGVQTGAATWEGRQLESFIAELDMRVDFQTTARQVYGEFKDRLRAEAEKVRERLEAGRVTRSETELEKGNAAPIEVVDRDAVGTGETTVETFGVETADAKATVSDEWIGIQPDSSLEARVEVGDVSGHSSGHTKVDGKLE